MDVARALGIAENEAAALRVVPVAMAGRLADLVAAKPDHLLRRATEEARIGLVHREIAQFAALDVSRMRVRANARTGRHQQFVLRFSHAKCSPKRHG